MLSSIDDAQASLPCTLSHCNIHGEKPSPCVDPAVSTQRLVCRNLERRRARTLVTTAFSPTPAPNLIWPLLKLSRGRTRNGLLPLQLLFRRADAPLMQSRTSVNSNSVQDNKHASCLAANNACVSITRPVSPQTPCCVFAGPVTTQTTAPLFLSVVLASN